MILCFNRLHISAKQLYQLIPEGRHQPLKRMADHNEDQRRGYQRGQLVSRRSEKSCCLDWFLLFAIFLPILSELLKYLMKIVLLHFGLPNQLEEDLVPG